MTGIAKPLARSRDLVIEEAGGEVLIYDENSETAHCLSPEAARVWRACDGHTTIDAITADVGIDADTVTRAVAELQSRNLLDDAHSGAGLTRRDFTVRAATVGAAAAVPLIVSVRPTVAEATMTPTPEECAEYNAKSCAACCQVDGCCCCCEGSGSANHDPGCKLCFPTAMCEDFTCPDAMPPVFDSHCSCQGGEAPAGTNCSQLPMPVMGCGCTY